MSPPAPLAVEVTMDSTTWAALALGLTALGALWTWVSWRRRGPAAGVRALAWTLVPLAAWLTGTLRLFVAVLEDVLDWATRLVFSPVVWLGIAVAGLAVVLWVVSGVMTSRGIGVRERGGSRTRPVAPAGAKQVPAAEPRRRGTDKASDPDDDMADIEAILKRHGI